jgi:hypothetical protein
MSKELTIREEAYQALASDRQRRFVEDYCTGKWSGETLNPTASGKAVGFADESYGRALRWKPHIRAAIEARLAELTMGKNEVLARITKIAEGDIGEVVTQGPNGQLRLDPDAVMERRHLIKSFSFDSNGNPKVEFFDPQAALRDLGKAHGIFKEGLDVGLSGAVAVHMTINFVVSHGGAPAPLGEQPALGSGEEG